MLSGRGLCDEPITRPEESYRLCCVVVCDLESSRIGAPYIYNFRLLRVKWLANPRVFVDTKTTNVPRNVILCVIRLKIALDNL